MNFSVVTENRVVVLLKKTLDAWLEDKALRLSAAVAYYSIFSIAPLLVISIGIAGLAFGEEAVRGQLQGQLTSYIGAPAAEGVQSLIQTASKPSQGIMATIIGFATLLLGASGVFGELKDALNTIWEVKAKPGNTFKRFFRDRLMNFGMVLVIGFLLMTSLLMTTAIAALNHYLEMMFKLPAAVWAVIASLVSFSIVTTLFAFIFKVLPDAKVMWRNVWIGAAVTAALFETGKFGLSFYLGRESTASGFGAAGAVILLLLWVYYSSCILFFGAEFTQVYARETGHRILPSKNAEPMLPEERARQGLNPTLKS